MDKDPFSIEDTINEIKTRKRLGDPALDKISPDIRERITDHAVSHVKSGSKSMMGDLDTLLDKLQHNDDEKNPQYQRGLKLGLAEYPITEISESSFDKHGLIDENDILFFQKGYLIGRVKAIGKDALNKLVDEPQPKLKTNNKRKAKDKLELLAEVLRQKGTKRRKVREFAMPYGGILTLLLVYGLSFIIALAYLRFSPW